MNGTLVKTLRVYQWSKNLLVLAALIFSQQLFVPGQLLRSVLAFVAFCAASSAMYILNDIIDIENDRAHPEKCHRPLASGAISIPTALGLCVGLLVLGVGLGLFLKLPFLLFLLLYLTLTALYSFVLKRVVIIDVMTIAIGFVVRAMAGAVVLNVVFSNWLVVCTLFLALFLSISKRRYEMWFLSKDAVVHREVLGHYSVPYLDALTLVVAGATLITYTIYTCSPDVVTHFGTDKLYLTLPFVVYGLFRYLYLVQHAFGGGDPSVTLFKDSPLRITVLLWGITCVCIIYWQHLFK